MASPIVLENLRQVANMLFLWLREDNDVIYVDAAEWL